jgi:Ribonuclease G/E
MTAIHSHEVQRKRRSGGLGEVLHQPCEQAAAVGRAQ